MPDSHPLLVAAVLLLLTYGLHSTIGIFFALVVDRLPLAASARATLWRLTVLAPVVTALLASQIAMDRHRDPSLSQHLEPSRHLDDPALVIPMGSGRRTAVPEGSPALPIWSGTAGPSAGGFVATRLPGSARPRIDVPRLLVISPVGLLLVFWIFGAALRLLQFARRDLVLRRALRDRQPMVDGPAIDTLRTLCAKAGIRRPVRLSVHDECPVPLAMGWREICLPEGLLGRLPPAELEAALAHELAHLARYDGLWGVLTGFTTAALFFQPLNRLAATRLAAAREEAADEWAVKQTGAPLALARCLADVGATVLAHRRTALRYIALLSSESAVVRRVRRLIAPDPDSRMRWASVQSSLFVGCFCAAAAVAPVLVVPEVRVGLASPPTPSSTEAEVRYPEPASFRSDPSRRQVAARRSEIATEPVVDQDDTGGFAAMLSDSDPMVRRDAVDAIGRQARWDSAPQVFDMVSDPDSLVRGRLASMIGLTEPDAGIPVLVSLLRDSSEVVRHSAAWAAGEFQPEALRAHGVPPALVERTTDTSAAVRRQAAASLGILELDAGIPALLRLLADESAAVRATAVWALGEFGQERLARHLVPLADDPSPPVRERVAAALARVPREDWRTVLVRLSSDQDGDVRRIAAYALSLVPRSRT
jgi:beta-lactamase regulating signal transducer with metallopeptidase domain